MQQSSVRSEECFDRQDEPLMAQWWVWVLALLTVMSWHCSAGDYAFNGSSPTQPMNMRPVQDVTPHDSHLWMTHAGAIRFSIFKNSDMQVRPFERLLWNVLSVSCEGVVPTEIGCLSCVCAHYLLVHRAGELSGVVTFPFCAASFLDI